MRRKIGDSIRWTIKKTEKINNIVEPVNLYGFRIVIKAYPSNIRSRTLFVIDSNNNTTDTYITTDKLNLGEFMAVIKNTDDFKVGTYDVEISYITTDGFKTTDKSFELTMVEKV